MPKFSIIVPAYNSQDWIRHGLSTIAYQSFTDYELIVVCDRCEDGTASVARQYTDLVFHCDFGNDGLTRNVGLDHATGEWILFMDDDDWWLHEFAFRQISDKLDTYMDDPIDVLSFGFIFRHIGYAPPIRKTGAIWPNVWSKCWRRDFIGSERFNNIPMASDLDFTKRLVIQNHAQFVTLDMPLYYYNYMRPGSQTEVASNDSETVS